AWGGSCRRFGEPCRYARDAGRQPRLTALSGSVLDVRARAKWRLRRRTPRAAVVVQSDSLAGQGLAENGDVGVDIPAVLVEQDRQLVDLSGHQTRADHVPAGEVAAQHLTAFQDFQIAMTRVLAEPVEQVVQLRRRTLDDLQKPAV